MKFHDLTYLLFHSHVINVAVRYFMFYDMIRHLRWLTDIEDAK